MNSLFKMIQHELLLHVKYNFYIVYSIITIIYFMIINLLPITYTEIIGCCLIFSDPSAIGLFTVGAMILLEKSQHLFQYYKVLPININNFILSKVLSLLVLSLVISNIIAFYVNINHIILMNIGVISCSFMFTLIAIMIGIYIESMNQYLIVSAFLMVPLVVPSVLNIFYDKFVFLNYFPNVICMSLIQGYHINVLQWFLLIIACIGCYAVCFYLLKNYWIKIGDAKL